ncbi:MAG TPA: HAD family hydrolase [Planctomycetota bacterium]|nr:HAD family hydrolase [Planctomycetota bacterium]
MTTPRVRAVLFDLDGVLIDSFDAWFHVVNAAAREFGNPGVDRERFGSVWGQGISADVKHLYPGRTHAEVEAAYERAMAAQRDTIHVNREAVATLEDLARRRIPAACVTNTQVGLARAILGATALLGRFATVEGMAEGRREKPAPDLLLAALSHLSVAPSDALMVGDSRYDREAAAAAAVPYLHYDMRTGASLASAIRAALDGARATP